MTDGPLHGGASMRPPPKEAEYLGDILFLTDIALASMRPPPKEAEYFSGRLSATTPGCFNEAASQRGGIHRDPVELRVVLVVASMRPPPKEAEYPPGAAEPVGKPPCFNEAASQRGGIPRAGAGPVEGYTEASMRPPPKEAEYARTLTFAYVTPALQ